MTSTGNTRLIRGLDLVLKTIAFLWFPACFWLKWTTGPASSLYDGLINAEFTSLIFIWLGWPLLLLRFSLNKPELSFPRLQITGITFIILYFLWSLASVNWSVSPATSLSHMGLWLQYLLIILFYAGILFLTDQEFVYKSITLWSLTLSLPVIYQYYLNGCYVPYLGLSYNRSIVGEALGGMVPLLFAVGWLKAQKGINWSLITGLLGFLSVLIMGQRAPLYGLVLGILGLGVAGFSLMTSSNVPEGKMIRGKILSSFAAIIVFSLLYLIPSPLTGQLQDWDTTKRVYDVGQAGEAGKYRILGLGLSWQQLKENPVAGNGAGTFPLNNFKARQSLMDNPAWHYLSPIGFDSIFNRAHCEPAQIAAELGIFGLFIWMAIFIVFPLLLLKYTFKYPATQSLLILAVIASLGAMAVSSLASSFGPRTLLSLFPCLVLIASLKGIFPPSQKDVRIPQAAFVSIICLLLLLNIAVTSQKVGDLKSCYYADIAELRLKLKPVPSFQEIATLYEKSIEASPRLPSAYSSTALLLARHEQLPDALEYIQAAYNLGFQSYFNLFLQTYSLWLSGKREEATKTTALMKQLAPKDEFLSLQNTLFQNALTKDKPKTTSLDKSPASDITPALIQSVLNRNYHRIKTPVLVEEGQIPFWIYYYILPTIQDSPELETQSLYLRNFHKPPFSE